MTFSEVLYEAACRMSEKECSHLSCIAVITTSHNPVMGAKYGNLMTHFPSEVRNAARLVGWPVRDFRTFMLLMASEAVK